MNNNIFLTLINMLNSIPVCGEDSCRKMVAVIDALRQMDKVANAPDEEVADGG